MQDNTCKYCRHCPTDSRSRLINKLSAPEATAATRLGTVSDLAMPERVRVNFRVAHDLLLAHIRINSIVVTESVCLLLTWTYA